MSNPEPSPAGDRLSHLANEIRCLWLAEKDLRDRAERGALKRTPEQIERYGQIMRALAVAGKFLAAAAKNPEPFMAWAKSEGIEF